MASSRNILRRQKTQQRVYSEKKAVQLRTNQGELSIYPAQTKGNSYGEQNNDLMEEVLSKQNMLKALRRVEKNKGAPGIDNLTDLYIEKFFDRINHDLLMARAARKAKDKRILRLIRHYLQSGVMVNGVKILTREGTPQGGPLSPLLANILLDDLDKELEKRGHKFVRYADDSNVYLKSKRAG